ncbi:uncharacterized protein ACBR49_010901 [Aulostomus maculatus]
MLAGSSSRLRRGAKMTALKEDLCRALEDLTEEQFKKFKWFLNQNDAVPQGFSAIRLALLERADRQDTVDLMVQTYVGPGALEVTMTLLEKIPRKDLVKNLEGTRSRLTKPRSPDPAPPQTESEGQKAKQEAEIKLMVQHRTMKIEELQRSTELSKMSAKRQIDASVKVFTILLQSVQTGLGDLIEAIEEDQNTMEKQADGLIQDLNKEILELTQRSAEGRLLQPTTDYLNARQNPVKNWEGVSVSSPSYEGKVRTAMNQLEEKVSTEMKKLLVKAELHRAQQFAVDVTLDPDTAHPSLILSDDRKQVCCGRTKQNLPDNPKRFDTCANVLGKQSFSSGRFYYEVTVKGKTSWDVGVVQESVRRKESITTKPKNGFWITGSRPGEECEGADRPVNRVGVFVDYERRSVSIYDVDAGRVLRSFSDCPFSEKLLPFFSPGKLHGDKNSAPLVISPVNNTDV